MGNWTYLFLILAWAGPIVVLQWLVGWPALRRQWRVWLATIALATTWLTAADSVALGSGTWTIAPAQSLGVFLPGGVPVEEGVFFLVTNTLVVQAALLLRDVELRQRVAAWIARGRPARGPV